MQSSCAKTRRDLQGVIMYLIGKKICPTCGIKGEKWKKNPDILICPSCKTFFNEFGVILGTTTEKEKVIT